MGAIGHARSSPRCHRRRLCRPGPIWTLLLRPLRRVLRASTSGCGCARDAAAPRRPLSRSRRAIDLSPRPIGSGKWTVSSTPGSDAHRHRTERTQPLDHLLHQDVRRRRAGREADAALAVEPLAPSGPRAGRPCRPSCPAARASSRRRLLFELVGLPTTITTSTVRRQHLDRVLPVLRGVADVLLLRLAHAREAALHRREDLGRVVDRQRGLRHHRELLGLRDLQRARRRPRPRRGRCPRRAGPSCPRPRGGPCGRS